MSFYNRFKHKKDREHLPDGTIVGNLADYKQIYDEYNKLKHEAPLKPILWIEPRRQTAKNPIIERIKETINPAPSPERSPADLPKTEAIPEEQSSPIKEPSTIKQVLRRLRR